tara:strand:+ start:2211 stop:3185 length:975 start_codon:yes stop_codon:yes gene_type:complete
MSLAVTSGYHQSGSTNDLYTGKFIPEIWSGKLQVKFYDKTFLSAITNNSWEGEIRNQGDKVEIRTVPTITISDYTKGLPLASQVPTTSVEELLIDKGKYFQVVVDDVDEVQADLQLMDIFTNDASQQMKIAIETQLLTALQGASATKNEGATAGQISGNINLGVSTGSSKTARKVEASDVVSHIIELGQVLDEQNVPEEGRWMVIPAWFASKIKTSDLKDASISGDSVSPMRNGRLGTIDRFTLYLSNLLPTTASVTGEGSDSSITATSIFAGTNDAITFASQFTRMETLRSTTTFGQIVRGLNVYGFKVIKPEAMAELHAYAG